MSLRTRLSALLGRPAPTRSDLPDEGLSPDPAVRREFLRRSLDEHLLEAEQGGELGAGGRAAWLGEHLEIYVSRCAGFAALTSTSAESVLDGSFFSLVEIGTEALRREIDASPPAPAAADAWRAYLRVLEDVRRNGDLEPLAASAGALRAALGGIDPYRREHA